MPEVKLALLGFGNVGQALARLLLEKRADLRRNYSLEWKAVGLFTRAHGSAIDRHGINLESALDYMARGNPLDKLPIETAPVDALDFIDTCAADVLFENSPVSYTDGEPALTHLRRALEHGMHAITANKGPVVHGYQQLRELAASMGRKFYFESTVMDGAPIFSLWREALPAAELKSLRGVLNSTTNLILTQMESGSTFEAAVRHAQDIGIAETDPSGDIDGWDASVKVAVLVTVLMDQQIRLADVKRQGIRSISLREVQAAVQDGRRWKLVCQAERTPDGMQASVQPELIGREDPLYNVMGTSSAVTFHSDVLGALTITEEDPGPHTTAYGLLADMLNAVVQGEAPAARAD
jgi:homoserine dehydrogenase